MTKEISAKVSFYLSLLVAAEAIAFVGMFAYLAAGNYNSVVMGDGNVPVIWLVYGAIDQLLLLAILITGIIGLKSAKRKQAVTGLALAAASIAIKYVVPFAFLAYTLSTSSPD